MFYYYSKRACKKNEAPKEIWEYFLGLLLDTQIKHWGIRKFRMTIPIQRSLVLSTYSGASGSFLVGMK